MEREYVIPNSRAAIEMFRRNMMSELSALDINEEDAFGFALSLSEALDNAYRHGNRCDEKRWITVRFSADAEQISIEVEDEGAGFAPDAVPDPTAPDRLTREGGRGVFLMRAYMDEVRYDEAGNRVRLVKRRSAA